MYLKGVGKPTEESESLVRETEEKPPVSEVGTDTRNP